MEEDYVTRHSFLEVYLNNRIKNELIHFDELAFAACFLFEQFALYI